MGSFATTPIKSRILRLTRLSCGVPVIGARTTLVTKGFIKVAAKAVTRAGTEFYQPNAWGESCVDEVDPAVLRRYDLTVDACGVDPDLLEVVHGFRAIAAGADDVAATGTTVGTGVSGGLMDTEFALEQWTKLGGRGCTPSGDPLWLYTAWPWGHNAVPGDETYEAGVVNSQFTFQTKGASASWGNGIYEAGLRAVSEGEHKVQYVTDVQPPDVTDGLVAWED